MTNRYLSSTGLALTLVTAGVTHTAPALAQSATGNGQATAGGTAAALNADAAANDTNSKEIIVTAQRRAERLFDVPLTVNVISGDVIDKQGYATIRDVLEHSPQVSFQQTGDQRTDTLSIRGLSSVSNASGVEPDAGIVIDGETLARTMEMNYDAIDVDRVEILEGPQGTLFGKNAVAGLINIVTRGPTLSDSIGGRFSLGIAEDAEYRAKASLNIPTSRNTALYLTGYYSYMGGWEENVHEGQPNAGKSKGWGFRGQFLYEPDDSFSILLRGEYTQKISGIIPYAFKSLTADDVYKASQVLSGGDAMADQFFGLLADSGINLRGPGGGPIINGTKSYLYDDRTWQKVHSHAFSIAVKKDFGAATLHYLAAYRYYNLYSNDNEWGVSAPQLTNSPDGLNTLNYAGPSTEKTFQQEVRLESNKGGPLSYVVGGFYYYNDNYHREINRTCNDAVYGYYNGSGYPDPNPVNPVDNFQCTGGYVGHYVVNDFETDIATHNEAIFGNVEYNFTPRASVFAGARMLWEQQHMTFQHLPDDTVASFFFDPTDPFGKVSEHDSRNAFIYKLGAKYDFGPVMLYGTYSTGFKGVSWDNYGLAASARLRDPLNPEKPTQWEAGMRGNVAHGLFDWQISAFRLVDHDFQARTIIRDPRFQLAVVDAGTSVTEGIQAGANLVVVQGLRIGGSYSWLPKAKLVDDVRFPNGPFGETSYLGARLPNAPRNSANAYASYTFGFPKDGLKSNLRLEYRYRGRQQSVLSIDPLQQVDAYGVFDLYYTVGSHDDRWNATFYVKNLFDKLYYQRAYEPAVMGFTTGQMAYLPRDYQRYVGVTLNYKF